MAEFFSATQSSDRLAIEPGLTGNEVQLRLRIPGFRLGIRGCSRAQVVMWRRYCVHEHKSVQVHGAMMQVVGQLREEAPAVLVAAENVRPAVAAARDMLSLAPPSDHAETNRECINSNHVQQFPTACVRPTLHVGHRTG